jgi:putative Holliday junction resolvase
VVAATRADTGTVLAFDFGARKIGVAIGNTLVRVANPLTTIRGESNSERFAAIGALVAEWQPQTLVVGRPLYADGDAHAITAQAERFARALEGRFRLPVMRVDERYTTQIADAQLREAGIRGAARAGSRDAVAAQLILQSWLDDTSGEGHRDAP